MGEELIGKKILRELKRCGLLKGAVTRTIKMNNDVYEFLAKMDEWEKAGRKSKLKYDMEQ